MKTLKQIIDAHIDTIGFARRMATALDSEVVDWTHVADVEASQIAAEIEKARTVTTVEELDALPVGTVVMGGNRPGGIYEKDKLGHWWNGDGDGLYLVNEFGSVRVLWLPTDEATA